MWKPPINFITLHYTYILTFGILGLIFIYPYGNLSSVDAYFFGVSASTESGLNTVDVKALKTYQQVVIYFSPILTQLGFVNIIVVIVRLIWFEKRLKSAAPQLFRSAHKSLPLNSKSDPEATLAQGDNADLRTDFLQKQCSEVSQKEGETAVLETINEKGDAQNRPTQINFDEAPHPRHQPKKLYIPSPREREQGETVRELDEDIIHGDSDDGDDDITKAHSKNAGPSQIRRRKTDDRSLRDSLTIEHVASSMFVIGASSSQKRPRSRATSHSLQSEMPQLSRQATMGRNSHFKNLTKEDREILGGLEYRALKLLLKIVVGYFFGLHIFAAVVLVGWIHTCDPKYRQYLASQGQDFTWWGFYSGQTMVNNLGFTLTPDSMITFQDAQWPMIFMSFLAYAGNTCYPCLLRLLVWVMYKIAPKNSAIKEPLQFLLKHPRRCYTLLFPSSTTWILFGILFLLNFIDIILIIVLDLNNPIVSHLSAGPRIAAAIFQAASSRHTGTSCFNLADVHPGVQFSLLIMMYISVYPIAIAVRASNTYEEKSLGMYLPDGEVEENKGSTYVLTHMQNQLSFDLWYIFLGVFCISIAEARKIEDDANPSFALFPILFEVVSAYGNVGLSLGHPSNLTSLSGHFTTFSKLVICAMMIRGRHRALPYQLDRAIMLPSERDVGFESSSSSKRWDEDDIVADSRKLKRSHTH